MMAMGHAAQPKEAAAGRRLTSEFLVGLARGASDETTRNAVRPLDAACRREIRLLCASDISLVQSALTVTNGAVNSPMLAEALRGVHVCLATNMDALSPPCLDAMVGQFLSGSTVPPSSNGGAVAAWPQPTYQGLPPMGDPMREQHRGHKMMRHHGRHGRGYDKDDDWDNNDAFDDKKLAAAGGLEVYVINNNGGGHVIDQLGDHRGHGRHEGSAHPLVWLVVLPFFCVGVFVVGKRVLAYIKERRQNGGMPFAAPDAEYVPLKASEAPPSP